MGKSSYDFEGGGKAHGVCFSIRLLVTTMCFMGTIALYMNRVNLSLAIVCMTEGSGTNDTNATTSSPFYSQQEPEFDWNSSLRGFILSSFFIGYLLTQVPTGWVIPKFKVSAKWLLLGGMAVTILISFLSPTAARGGWGYLVALQILKGMACGTYYPSMQHIITSWAPPMERSRLNAFAQSGAALGSVITFASSGFLCENGYAGGWPSVFYTYAICGSLWAVLWITLVHDNPSQHPCISHEEKVYIEKSIAAQMDQNKKTRPVPWFSILTSLPVWAIIITDFGYQWLWYTALTLLPTYFNDVLKFEISTNGLLSSLPYIANLVITLGFSAIADYMIHRKVPIAVVRKIACSCALLIPTALVIATGFLDESQSAIAVAFLTISVGCLGFTRSGHTTNQIDIAPRFGAVMMGISNSAGTIAGIVAPIASGQLTPNGTQEEWRNVFFVAGGLTLLGEIVFMIFGRGEVQPWATFEEEDEESDQGKIQDGDQDGFHDEKEQDNEQYIPKQSGTDNPVFTDTI